MKLNVLERLTLLPLLPNESDYVTLKIVRNAQGLISFSEEEIKKYDLISEETDVKGETRTKWNPEGEQETDIELSPKIISILSEELEKLNKNKKLKQEHYSLYEKFVEEKE